MFERSRVDPTPPTATLDPPTKAVTVRGTHLKRAIARVVGLAVGAAAVLFAQERYLPPRLSAQESATLRTAYGQADAEILAGSSLEGAFVPLRLPRSFAVIALDVTWDQLVRETLERQGGTARVSDLYRSLSRHPKARGRQHWRAKVRQTLQRGEYRRVDRGLWAA